MLFNPKDLARVMKQLNIKQESIEAKRVIIECDDKQIIVQQPEVIKLNVQGQVMLQITGQIKEQARHYNQQAKDEQNATSEEESEEDIRLVMQQTNCSYEQAKQALSETNDIAKAILKLKSKT